MPQHGRLTQYHTLARSTNPLSLSPITSAAPRPPPIPLANNVPKALPNPNSVAIRTACPASNHPESEYAASRIKALTVSTVGEGAMSVACAILSAVARHAACVPLTTLPSRARAPTIITAVRENALRCRRLAKVSCDGSYALIKSLAPV